MGKNSKIEFCIMNDNPPIWRNFRFSDNPMICNRHEAFFGRKNRQKSIDDGLVVFLTQQMHEGTNGVHGKNGHKLDMMIKKQAQETWCKYYNKTTDDFRERYGRNYI